MTIKQAITTCYELCIKYMKKVCHPQKYTGFHVINIHEFNNDEFKLLHPIIKDDMNWFTFWIL